ncbi:MAG: hypothetical protein VKL42_01685 [Snowella sp.]|nr:hypothetical protein [Snowella sp.]
MEGPEIEIARRKIKKLAEMKAELSLIGADTLTDIIEGTPIAYRTAISWYKKYQASYLQKRRKKNSLA